MIIQNEKKNIEQALNYIETGLERYGLKKRDRTIAMLTAEEALVTLMEHASDKDEIEITFKKIMGNVYLNLTSPGEEFDISESQGFPELRELDGINRDMEHAIRGLILRSRADSFRYKNKMHRNTIQITVKKSDRMQLCLTLSALLFAILLGTVLKNVLPQTAQNGLNSYLLTPVKTMFLNALKVIVGPVVFFSIVTCLSQFDNLRDLGKIGAKVMGMYLMTTILAVLVGIGTFFVLKPGDASLAAFVSDVAKDAIAAGNTTEISILDTVVGIVPSNIVKPFLEANMLQIIFLAILCGVAVGMIGDYSQPLKSFFESCNMLFLKITTLIVKVLPLAVLCAMTSLVMMTGTQMLVSIMGYVGTFIIALAIMIGIYCLLVIVIARINPLKFIRKHAPTMLTSFSLASSNAAMPFNIQSCQKMGISSKICSFSIPLGATINMDGSCVYMALTGLFLAKVFGIELDGASMFYMIFSIIVLSIGAPGIPGSSLVCLSVLLAQLGVPAEALGLIMGIDALLGMFRVAVNSTGDVAVALVVAKTEKLLDIEKYNQ